MSEEVARGMHLGPAELDDTVRSVLAAARRHLDLEVHFTGAEAQDGGAIDLSPARGARGSARVLLLEVPLMLPDGTRCGTLACHGDPSDPCRESAERSLRLLADVISCHVESRRRDSESWRTKIRHTGLQALLAALDARDGYTRRHSEAVVDLSASTARAMGLPSATLDEVKQVALVHDLGKIAIPRGILNKHVPLSAEEWARMQEHSVIGARIVASVEELRHLAPAVRAAHERWDGLGYPDGLAGEEIPLPSRIVALCDAFHAMVSARPYSPGMSPESARGEVATGAGSQFCPLSAEALLTLA